MIDYEKIKSVTYNQIDMMKHVIGFDNKHIKGTKRRRMEPYRNYYDAGPRDESELNALANLGLMQKSNPPYSLGICYHVTEDGRKFLEMVTGVEILPVRN
ncbi:MAG: hypothetical protein K2I93_04355 [Oscillospiraceae bacterium]|nr:hypothetical protein [Oscillospiraceae bacterium]